MVRPRDARRGVVVVFSFDSPLREIRLLPYFLRWACAASRTAALAAP